MPSQKQIREEITKRIVEALEKGVKPWRRPWSISKNSGRPANVVSRRPYSGINPILLQLHSLRFGFRSRWWGTFHQWSELGCFVKRRPDGVEPGRWGASIVLWKPFKKTVQNDNGEQEEQEFMLMRYFTVFSADQVEGAEKFQVRDEPASDNNLPDYGPAEHLIAATQADIRHGGDRAYYVRPQPDDAFPHHDSGDFIVVPPKHRYDPLGAYYETLLHEISHWSEVRTGWDYRKQGYPMGELAAEIASSYLSTELGVPQGEPLENHASYVQAWLNEMKGDPVYVFKASTQASKVADFLLGLVRQPEPVAVGESLDDAQ